MIINDMVRMLTSERGFSVKLSISESPHMLFFISRRAAMTSTGSFFPVAFCTAGS